MKKTLQHRKPVLVALALCAALASAAQQPAAPTNAPSSDAVSIEALVTEAMEKNPELQFYRAELAAAKAGRKTAGVFANPQLATSVGEKRVLGPAGTLTGEGVAWSVGVSQTFEWPGRIGLRKSIANRDIELAELGLQQFRTALAGRVRSLSGRVHAAHGKAAAAREVADRFDALLQVLVQRDPAGLTPLLETRIIEANTLTLQRRATSHALAAQDALLELNQLRGQPSRSRLAVAGGQPDLHASESVDSLLDRARTSSFELRLRQSELAQQGFKVALAKNERFPSVTVSPFVSRERASDRETILGVGLSLPLPLWNQNQGGVEAAKSRQQQAEVSLGLALRDVEQRVVSAALGYQSKLAEMSRWRPDSVARFREAAELADRHYRLGAVPVTTYVELQKQYLDAVEALHDTRQEAIEAAAQLEQLTGVEFFGSAVKPH